MYSFVSLSISKVMPFASAYCSKSDLICVCVAYGNWQIKSDVLDIFGLVSVIMVVTSLCVGVVGVISRGNKKLKLNEIKDISKKEFMQLSDFNIAFGVSNKDEWIKEFENHIEDVDLTCIIIPWCLDMETKGT